MSRANQWAEQRRREEENSTESFWQTLCERISDGQLIPIISNAVNFDQIFDIDDDHIIGVSIGKEDRISELTIEEQLTETWATRIGYPLAEQYRLARVAQYNRVVKSHDDLEAKARFLYFLKDLLLFLAEEDSQVEVGTVNELRKELGQLSFAEIARELDYPKFKKGQVDPLRVLAQFNLPIYITTSYFDFMERALIAVGRKPRTQICFWAGQPVEYAHESHHIDSNFVPNADHPLVYHLFGLESYPESLVLSEDDHLDFLAKISHGTSQKKPILPLYLRKALTQSSLLLLGYRLQDWDFRILFRGIISGTPSSLRKFSLAIQLDPRSQQKIVSADEARRYLQKYFGACNFNVEWGTTISFVRQLWQVCSEQWR